jgi:hypothetical protein
LHNVPPLGFLQVLRLGAHQLTFRLPTGGALLALTVQQASAKVELAFESVVAPQIVQDCKNRLLFFLTYKKQLSETSKARVHLVHLRYDELEDAPSNVCKLAEPLLVVDVPLQQAFTSDSIALDAADGMLSVLRAFHSGLVHTLHGEYFWEGVSGLDLYLAEYAPRKQFKSVESVSLQFVPFDLLQLVQEKQPANLRSYRPEGLLQMDRLTVLHFVDLFDTGENAPAEQLVSKHRLVLLQLTSDSGVKVVDQLSVRRHAICATTSLKMNSLYSMKQTAAILLLSHDYASYRLLGVSRRRFISISLDAKPLRIKMPLHLLQCLNRSSCCVDTKKKTLKILLNSSELDEKKPQVYVVEMKLKL